MPTSISGGRRLALLAALAAIAGCNNPDRYRVVDGPAQLTVGATAFTPGVSVSIERGGRAYFGPSFEPPTAPPVEAPASSSSSSAGPP